MDPQALGVSLRLAVATAVVLGVVGTPAAWWLSQRRGWLRTCCECLVAMPLVLPPTVLGFFLLIALSPSGAVGGLWQRVTGQSLAFSFFGVLCGSVILNLPMALRPMLAGFQAINPRLREASYCLGASPLRTLWCVELPLAAPSVVAGIVLAFAHALGEFGVAMMVGGSIPGVTRTLSIAIYDDVQALQYASATRTAVLLLVMAGMLLIVISWVERRRRT